MGKVPYINHVITFDLKSKEELRVAFNINNGVGFCLNDICEILSLDRRETRRGLGDDDIFQHRAPTDGGWQWMTFLTSNSLYAILNKLALGRVMPLISELKEWVIPAIMYHMDNEWGETEDDETIEEVTCHKFDESTNKSTDRATDKSTGRSTHGATDKATEVTQMEDLRQVVLVINLK